MGNDATRMGGFGRITLAFMLAVGLSASASTLPHRADEGWIELIGSDGLQAWTPAKTDWQVVRSVSLDRENPKKLDPQAGEGEVIYNGPTGKTKNIVTKQKFGDIEAHFEFNVPKGSNSGVKFEGLYEIQIADSWGVKKPTASHSGGIYPRAELLPRYHYLDEGYPPKVNAAMPPGEWQTLDVIFQAPRFDTGGKKLANARIVKAVLNGQVIHENVELSSPTGHAWHDKESPTGPILLQADHGPVAFRKIRVRPWTRTGTQP
jgi:hypothetical protein